MNRALRVSIAALVMLAVIGGAFAAAIAVKVNGKTVRNKVAPFTRHSTKFVEIQPVCKASDVKYEYDKDAGRVTLCYGDKCTAFTVGEGPKNAYIKNDKPTAAYKVLAEKLGGKATYNSEGAVISFEINH